MALLLLALGLICAEGDAIRVCLINGCRHINPAARSAILRQRFSWSLWSVVTSMKTSMPRCRKTWQTQTSFLALRKKLSDTEVKRDQMEAVFEYGEAEDVPILADFLGGLFARLRLFTATIFPDIAFAKWFWPYRQPRYT